MALRLGPLDLGNCNALVLHILHMRGRSLGDMHGAAANHRAACGKRGEFHKCHPYRHS